MDADHIFKCKVCGIKYTSIGERERSLMRVEEQMTMFFYVNYKKAIIGMPKYVILIINNSISG